MYATDNNGARAEVMRKADICAQALLEARRLPAAATCSSVYSQLVSRIGELLDELDDALLILDHTSDRGAFERVAALHSGFEDLEFRRNHLGIG
jgi:hypothetical protein